MTGGAGTYSTISRHYQDEGTAPKVAAVIGANVVWELINKVARSIASILGGLLVPIGSGGTALLVINGAVLSLYSLITIADIEAQVR